MSGSVDPDAAGVPLHRRPGLLGLVALGGAIGTAVRAGVAAAFGGPIPIAVVNVLGAFALGLLLESLARRGSDTGRRRAWRLFGGTGVLGGFTTYSTMALDAALPAGSAIVAMLLTLGSVVVGVLAAAAGIAVARRGTTRA